MPCVRRLIGARRWIALALVFCAVAPALAANPRDFSLRLRVEWGGGAERIWEGALRLSQGTLSDPAPLGVEADEPGSMWLADNVLRIRQQSGRTYDGVDISVSAARSEQLIVQLNPVGQEPGQEIRIPLANVLGEYRTETLDQAGNRLLVRRTPGDRLRVSIKNRDLVFAPGDVLRIEVEPHQLPVDYDYRVRVAAQLIDARASGVVWQADQTIQLSDQVPVPFNIPLRNSEGVYDVLVTATPIGWQQTVRYPLGVKPLAERRLQVVVIDPKPPAPPKNAPGDLTRVGDEIDPVTARRPDERLVRLPSLPGLSKSKRPPLSVGQLPTRQHPLGVIAQLPPSRPNDMTWEAYALPVLRPGVPHVLEVEYPSDVAQTLGISIIEPNSAGAVSMGLDSGVDVPDGSADLANAARWLKHRMLFWPRTKNPLVLLTNRSERSAAVYGKIRVLAGWERLPAAAKASGGERRMIAGYLDRPLLPENFSANETLDAWVGRSLDDWTTFYEAGTRLVDYLHYVGMDGLMVNVLADGSTIYPSALLQPTPRYDTGAFFDSGQDPLRKDFLEMLLRMFEREQLRLVAGLEFAAPLPELEKLLRKPGAESDGLQLIGPTGQPWTRVYGTRRGLAPYYNVLDPRVQDAMLAVVRELATNYAKHTALAGVALRLSADGYAQLPGLEWGLDDATIGRFQRDTGTQVPGEGPQRFAQRAKALASEPTRRAWLQWRAQQIGRFHERLQSELNAVRSGCKLYLAGAECFNGPHLQEELRPALPRRSTLADALLLAGLDPRQSRDNRNLALLRPEQIAPLGSLGAQAINIEVQQLPDADRIFQETAVASTLLFHPPQRVTLPSFDERCPFKPCATELISQIVPSGRLNRRRFIRAIAVQDAAEIFDGGWLLPLGQEDSLRDLIQAYRRLPASRFTRVAEQPGAEPAQPLVMRYYQDRDRTWAYVLNDSPFAVSGQVRIEAPANCAMEELSGQRAISPVQSDAQGSFWPVDLEPYDLVAVCWMAGNVRPLRVISRPAAPVDRQLAARIAWLVNCSAQLGSPPPMPVLKNPGFELHETAGLLPGWTVSNQASAGATLDRNLYHNGAQALRLYSDGAAVRLTSEPFAAPATGRISVSVWLRVTDVQHQPPLQLAIDGKLDGRDYYRYAPLGQPPQGMQQVPAISNGWANYVFQVDDLPLEGIGPLRVRIDLAGPGEVWIDDVQVHHLYFSKRERVELSKLIALADVKLQQGQLADCIRLLEGYWPRFLEANVAAAMPAAAQEGPEVVDGGQEPPGKAAQESGERSGLFDRMRNALPRVRF